MFRVSWNKPEQITGQDITVYVHTVPRSRVWLLLQLSLHFIVILDFISLSEIYIPYSWVRQLPYSSVECVLSM